MWFLMIFWKSFRGMWRLVVGLIIGVVLYIVTFTNQNLVWIFNDVYTFSNFLVDWLSAQSWFDQYEKWNNLVKPGDRLPLILYILVGRFIWLLIEEIVFVFPYWLIFGRKKKSSVVVERGTPPPPQQVETAQAPSIPVAIPAPIVGANGGSAFAVNGNHSANGSDEASRDAGDLERSIDDALERIRQAGKRNSND